MSKVLLKKLKVYDLHSRRYEGLALDDLSEGLTVVYGPNAAGKSVLARAASRVLNPSSLERTDNITGRIEWNGQGCDIDLRGRNDGAPWPQSVRADLYRLSIADIVKAPSKADQEKIKEAFSGGINLEKMAVPGPGRKPKKAIENALKQLAESQTKSRALADDEARIPELEQQIEMSKQAGRDAVLLEKWLAAEKLEREKEQTAKVSAEILAKNPGIDKQRENVLAFIKEAFSAFKTACAEYDNAQEHLQRFGGEPAGKTLQAVDGAALQAHENRIEELSGKRTVSCQHLESAKQKVNDADLALQRLHDHRAPTPLSSEAEQRLESLIKHASSARQKVSETQVRLEEARNRLERAVEHYNQAGGDPGQIPENPASVDDLHAALDLDAKIAGQEGECSRSDQTIRHAKGACSRAKERLPAIQVPARAVMDQLQETPIASVIDSCREATLKHSVYSRAAEDFEAKAGEILAGAADLEEAETALTEWLRFASPAYTPLRRFHLVLMVLAFALVTGILASILDGNWIVTVPLLGMILVAVFAARGQRETPDASLRDRAAARIPQPWKPADWTSDDVVFMLGKVISQRRLVNVLKEKASESRHIAEAVNMKKPQQEWLSLTATLKEATGLDLPADPEDYKIASLVQALHTLLEAENALAQAEKDHDDKQQKREEMKQTRLALIHDRIGAPHVLKSGAAVKVWADRLQSLHRARADVEQVEKALNSARQAQRETHSDLGDFFNTYGWPYAEDEATAQKQFLEWFSVTETLIAAEKDRDHVAEDVRGLTENLASLEEAITTIFDDYGFPNRPDLKPRQQTSAFREWFDITDRFNRYKRAIDETNDRLTAALNENGIPLSDDGGKEWTLADRVAECEHRANDVFPGWYDSQRKYEECQRKMVSIKGDISWQQVFARQKLGENPTVEAVDEKRETLLEAASREEDLRDQISGTRRLVSQAEKANNLQGAQEAVRQAVADMDGWLRRQQDNLAWQGVVDVIGQAVRDESTPAIVDKANEHLKSLTGGRYENISVECDDIRVTDAKEDRVKIIAQLSTGTRIHLALALRLAVIEMSETANYAFPLLLDEVMASSDPKASKAIAQAIKHIAEERQILLFTNQPDDINVIRREFGENIPVRTLGAAVPVPHSPVLPPSLPSVDYREGQIPFKSAVSQWPPQLLTGIVETIDPSCRTVYDALMKLDGKNKESAKAIVAALEAVRKRIARTRRVLETGDLTDAAWITPAFREKVDRLLDDVNGCPEKFLQGFRELPRMRSSNVEACEAWLEGNGYLEDMPTLNELHRAARHCLPEEMPDREASVQKICGLFRPGTG